MRASWNNVVLAESGDTIEVEGNHYFPRDTVHMTYIRPSDTHTTCPWKGVAHYYTIEVDGKTNVDAAWYYPDPKEAALHIRDRVAFWKGIEISK